MKFALAFVLLIGISCQIGQGDCAPDGIYESLSGMMSGAYSLTQTTYHSVMNHLSPLTDYLPSPPSSLTSYLPSVSSVTDPLTGGLSDIKESSEILGSKAGDMLESGLDSTKDLGSEAEDLMKSGMGQIRDTVNY